jgi:hypothetical protein
VAGAGDDDGGRFGAERRQRRLARAELTAAATGRSATRLAQARGNGRRRARAKRRDQERASEREREGAWGGREREREGNGPGGQGRLCGGIDSEDLDSEFELDDRLGIEILTWHGH